MIVALLLGALALLSSFQALADTIRVTSWNLHDLGTNDLSLKQAADALIRLNPDVVLLQGARNWEMCAQIAEAMKPEQYYVLICSSFRHSTSQTANDQVAVLSKAKAYFSWSEPWRSSTNSAGDTGFAFVALQTKGQRLGFFCLNCPDSAAPSTCAQQLRQQINAVNQWEANRPQGLIVGLSFTEAGPEQEQRRREFVTLLQQAGFIDAFQALPSSERITRPSTNGHEAAAADFLLTQSATFPLSPQISRPAVAASFPVTCDFELDPLRVAAGWTALAQDLQRRSEQNPAANASPASPKSQPAELAQARLTSVPAWGWAVGGALVVILLFSVWLLVRVSRRPIQREPRLLPANIQQDLTTASSYTVVMSLPPETESSGQALSIPSQRIVQDLPTVQTDAAAWQERARAAEEKAERAQSILKESLTGTLGRWLKKKLVRKLVSDRAQLLETQQSAALKAMKVDERLARIEKQVQQQTQIYSAKIEELTRELLAAREENRELIRARIAQVKLEMEAVRARMMAQADQQFGTVEDET